MGFELHHASYIGVLTPAPRTSTVFWIKETQILILHSPTHLTVLHMLMLVLSVDYTDALRKQRYADAQRCMQCSLKKAASVGHDSIVQCL